MSFSLSENSSYKIVALLITLILWVIILGSKEATIVKMIPTDYLLPKEMAIVNGVPREVAFRLSGPRLALKRFSETAEPLAIDLTSAVEGMTTIRIHPDSIDVPPGIRVASVSPATITPKLEKLLHTKVPVEIQTKGELSPGHRIIGRETEPTLVEIEGPRSSVEAVKFLKTEPLDISGADRSLTRDVGLVIDMPGIIKRKDTQVRVNLEIK